MVCWLRACAVVVSTKNVWESISGRCGISFHFQVVCLLFLLLAPQVPSKDTSVCGVVTDLDLDPISDSLQRSPSSVISPKIAIVERASAWRNWYADVYSEQCPEE